MQILSTTINGQGLIFGPIYDASGENATIKLANKYFPDIGEAIYIFSQKAFKNSIELEIEAFKEKNKDIIQKNNKKRESVKNAIWNSLESSNYIENGNPNAPMFYMFTDLFCSHCNDLSVSLKPYIERNLIRVRYIPIPFMTKESAIGTVGILSSPNPKLAWLDYHNNKNVNVLKTTPTDEGISKAEYNMDVFNKWKLRGTPSIFYRTKNGEVKFLYGKPETIEELLNDLTR